MAPQLKNPNVFNYMDLRLFLKDVYHFRKRTEKSFSYEVWAEELGLKSRSFLRLVITGKRSLTPQVFPLFVHNLNFSKEELDYFTVLYRYSTAVDHTLKESYGRQLITRWKVHLDQVTIDKVDEFLNDPSIPIVFTYFSKENVSSNVEAIAKTLGISKQRVLLAIQTLTQQRLLIPELGENLEVHYRTVEPHFRVPTSAGNQFIKNFHMEGLKQAVIAHDLPFDQRKFRSLVLTMTEEQMKNAQELINNFAQTVLSSMNSENEKSEDLKSKIYRLNLQLFPVSEEL